MKEAIPGYQNYDNNSQAAVELALENSKKLGTFMLKAFMSHGFDGVVLMSERIIDDSRHLFDESRAFGRYKRDLIPTGFTVYAQKKVKQTFALS